MIQNVVGVIPPRSGNVERRNAIDILSRDPKNFAARRQDRDVRSSTPGSVSARVATRIDEVLAIVQDQQQFFVPNGMRDGFRRGAVGDRPVSLSQPPRPPARAPGPSATPAQQASLHYHPANSPSTRRAAFRPRLVLPMPPGPVRVTTR